MKKSEKPLTSDSRVLTSTTASLNSGSAPAFKESVQLIDILVLCQNATRTKQLRGSPSVTRRAVSCAYSALV